jgi:hypothetical protein
LTILIFTPKHSFSAVKLRKQNVIMLIINIL